jgi:hypothetical protein
MLGTSQREEGSPRQRGLVTSHEHFFNIDYSAKSWLLTTDHKRIALLYLVSVSFFFVLGGIYAMLIRLELMTPRADVMAGDMYNKVFTMHGFIMVFFFLIPAIPATLGNFLVPLMIGAKDLAFPRLNLTSWYVYSIGGMFTILVLALGGVDTGWTFYTPYSSTYSNSYVILAAVGAFFCWFFLNLYRPKFYCHHSQDARAGDDLVPAAAVYLGPLCGQSDYDLGHAGGSHRHSAGGHRAHLPYRHF